MKKSTLKPFLREELHVLFVGLNPATGSSNNGHYFSVNSSFWSQLHHSGLVRENLDKSNADTIVFGSQSHNYKNWSFGITDLVIEIAESNSRKITPTTYDCKRLEQLLKDYKPLTVVILHGKVVKHFLKYLGYKVPVSNSGYLGELMPGTSISFFNIAFPHGNNITNIKKIEEYKHLKYHIDNK